MGMVAYQFVLEKITFLLKIMHVFLDITSNSLWLRCHPRGHVVNFVPTLYEAYISVCHIERPFYYISTFL